MFGRYYEWKTSVGVVETRCRRALIFFGDWACTARKYEPPSL